MITQDHLSVVDAVLAGFSRRVPPAVLEDLRGVAHLALMKYNQAELGEHLAARLRCDLLDELRRIDTMPRRSRAKAKRIRSAEIELEQTLRRKPCPAEIAEVVSLPEGLVNDILELTNPDFVYPEIEDLADDQESPAASAARKDMAAAITAAIDRLTPRQAEVLRRRYMQGQQFAEIGEALGLSGARCQQIEKAALKRLRMDAAIREAA
jgi:RNA polymerase sigma factor for flagellar operon FliA